MISEKSFWVKLIKHTGGKIWMWVVAVIALLVKYPIGLMIKYNSIEAMYSDASMLEMVSMRRQMYDATSAGLGLSGGVLFFLLAAIFGIGIFAFVNNRSRMDAVKSMPIKTSDLFLYDYLYGIFMVVGTYIVSLLLAVLVALGWGYLSRVALAEMAMGAAINIIMFVLYYNIAIICVCLTGNLFIALCGFVGISLAPYVFEAILYSMRGSFFKSAEFMFAHDDGVLAPIYHYVLTCIDISNSYRSMDTLNYVIKKLSFYPCIWLILAAVTTYLAYLTFSRRPAEALNNAVYSRTIRTIAKIIFGVCVALACGFIAYDASSDGVMIYVIAVVVAGVLIGMAAEAIYDYDVKSALKNIWSTVVIVVTAVAIICVFRFDVFGYDRFMPTAGRVESFAIDSAMSNYGDIYKLITDETGKITDTEWDSQSYFYRDNMFLTNIDAIAKLTEICQSRNLYNSQSEDNIISIPVLYRMKGGFTTSRNVYVDMNDAESVKLLNDIIATREWRQGQFQVLSIRDRLQEMGGKDSYSDGINTFVIDGTRSDLITAWEKDMEVFDLYRGRGEYPIGVIRIGLVNGMGYSLPVYSDFANTRSIVEASKKYSDIEASPDNIESIRVTNYHNEVYDGNTAYDYDFDPSVSATITDKDKISELLGDIIPGALYKVWDVYDEKKGSYDIIVTFDASFYKQTHVDTLYYLFAEDVPEWVKSATASAE